MPCSNSILNSFTIDCNDSNGGVAQIKVRAFDANLVTSGLATVTSGQITFAGNGLTDWYAFDCAQETSVATSDGATDRAAGTSVHTQTITYINNKLKVAFRNTLNNMHGMLVHVAVKDNNGNAWLFGYERGLIVSASSSATGTAFNERNGYSVTFTGREKDTILNITNYDNL
jgi:hypothetical protein